MSNPKDHQLSYRADEDIQAILEFIAEDDPDSALRVIDAIQHTINQLKRSPETGFKPDYLKRPQDNMVRVKVVTRFRHYLIFYEVIGEQLHVLRILHSSRNLISVFENDESSLS